MANLADLLKPALTNAGAGGGLNNLIIMFDADDVETMPDRGVDDISIAGNIVMKAGKYMHILYMTPKTLEPTFKKVEGENSDITAFEVGIKGFHPGLEKEVLQFMAQQSGTKFYMMMRNCALNKTYLFGEPCNELEMKECEAMWGKTPTDGKGVTLSFLTVQSLPPAIYAGTFTLADESSSASASTSTSV